MQATLTASATTVAPRSTVNLTATVTKASGPVSGASVTFRIARAGGATATATAVTNASGVATYGYKAQQKGSYTASATATLNTATASSNSVSFSAQ